MVGFYSDQVKRFKEFVLGTDLSVGARLFFILLLNLQYTDFLGKELILNDDTYCHGHIAYDLHELDGYRRELKDFKLLDYEYLGELTKYKLAVLERDKDDKIIPNLIL